MATPKPCGFFKHYFGSTLIVLAIVIVIVFATCGCGAATQGFAWVGFAALVAAMLLQEFAYREAADCGDPDKTKKAWEASFMRIFAKE